MPDISSDTWAQIIANVIIGSIAVVGTLRGAKVGAEVGAKATRDATTEAIAEERRAAQEQRLHEDRTLIRALITETRLNAATLRKERLYQPDPRMMVPLRQSALDRATGALADLPEKTRKGVELTISDLLWFNQLVTTRVSQIDDKGDTVSKAFTDELAEVCNLLPDRLDKMAAALEEAISTKERRP